MLLQFPEFLLDLALVDARLFRRHQLGLELAEDANDGFHAGIGCLDLRRTKSERILDRGNRLAVRSHGRRDRPVGCVLGRRLDPQPGAYLALRRSHAGVDRSQSLERRNCPSVRMNADHIRNILKLKIPIMGDARLWRYKQGDG